jgi:hypothetical protein
MFNLVDLIVIYLSGRPILPVNDGTHWSLPSPTLPPYLTQSSLHKT